GTGEPARAPSTDTAVRLHPVPLVREISSQHVSANAGAQILMPHGEHLSAEAFAFELPPDDDGMVVSAGSPASLYPGDIIIVDPGMPPSLGSVVLARDGKRVIARRVRTNTEERDGRSDRVVLVAANTDYGTLEVAADKVVGVVIAFYRRAR